MAKKLTRRQAIHQHCLDCMLDDVREVTKCVSIDCKLFPYRKSQGRDGKPKYNPAETVTRYCMDCIEGTIDDVQLCEFDDCPLFECRMGKDPNSHRTGPIKEYRYKR